MTLIRNVLVSLAVVLALAPVAASAMTSAEIQAQIEALIAQVRALQSQTTTSSEQANCVDISSNLTLGSSGGQVSALQAYLIRSGLLDAQYGTGYYGFITAQAVGKAQMNLGVLSSASDSAYGIVGPKTRSALACSGTTSTTVTPTSPAFVLSCTLTASKSVVAAGESQKLRWRSTGATYAAWNADSVRTLALSTDKLDANGDVTFSMPVQEKDGVRPVLNVYSADGRSASCNTLFLFSPSSSSVSSATIDQSTLTAKTNGPTTITGTASGASSVYVYLLAPTYTNAYDYASAYAAVRGDDNKQTGITAYPSPVPVTNGRWSAYFGGWFTSEQNGGRVVVYDALTKARLAIGTLFVPSSNKTSIPTQTSSVRINSFTASPTTASEGDLLTFRWNTNLSATDISYWGGGCSLDAVIASSNTQYHITDGFDKNVNGSATYRARGAGTYTLRCSSGGKDGDPMATARVTVPLTSASTATTCSLNVSKNSIAVGERATLVWKSTNATTAVIDGNVGLVSPNGETTIAPIRTTTYTFAVSGVGGSKYCTATINVGAASSSNSSTNTATASTNTTTSTAAPTCSISSNKSSITTGETATLSWSSTNATLGVIDNNVGTVANSGSTTIAPIRTTTYTYAVQGAGGSKYCTTSVNVSAASAASLSACTTATGHRGGGGSYSCSCSGNFSLGSVWGSGPYTDDSNICAAALHAGVISSGGGNVTYTLLGSNDSYEGSSHNGVTSNSYGPWNWSYSLSRGPTSVAPSTSSLAAALAAIQATLQAMQKQVGL